MVSTWLGMKISPYNSGSSAIPGLGCFFSMVKSPTKPRSSPPGYAAEPAEPTRRQARMLRFNRNIAQACSIGWLHYVYALEFPSPSPANPQPLSHSRLLTAPPLKLCCLGWKLTISPSQMTVGRQVWLRSSWIHLLCRYCNWVVFKWNFPT